MEVNEGDTLLSLTPNIDEKDLLDRLDEEAGKEGEEDDDTGNEGEE